MSTPATHRPQIVAATGNPAKVAQIERLVGGVAVVSPAPRDIAHEVGEAETGSSLAAIARTKAVAWSRALGTDELVVATDGGLVVPALGAAWNPLRTRRFAGPAASNRDRADALLALAAGLTGDERRIWWREGVAVAGNGRALASWEETGPSGLLAPDYDPADLVGSDGFWVSAVWLCPELGGRRLAHLTPAETGARDDHWRRLGAELRRFIVESTPSAGPLAPSQDREREAR